MNAVIMGRKTWESIPEAKRPLANRLNIILTRDVNYNPIFSGNSTTTPAPVIFSSFGASMDAVNARDDIGEVFVIGGQALFEEALSDEMSHLCKLIIATRINRDYEADIFMPAFENKFEPLFISQTYS
jgi:dihydrofolate reductase